jgi:hypothetical protein
MLFIVIPFVGNILSSSSSFSSFSTVFVFIFPVFVLSKKRKVEKKKCDNILSDVKEWKFSTQRWAHPEDLLLCSHNDKVLFRRRSREFFTLLVEIFSVFGKDHKKLGNVFSKQILLEQEPKT